MYVLYRLFYESFTAEIKSFYTVTVSLNLLTIYLFVQLLLNIINIWVKLKKYYSNKRKIFLGSTSLADLVQLSDFLGCNEIKWPLEGRLNQLLVQVTANHGVCLLHSAQFVKLEMFLCQVSIKNYAESEFCST